MKDIALFTWDETWVDTHHTASHQWTPPNPSDARKIPLNKGKKIRNCTCRM